MANVIKYKILPKQVEFLETCDRVPFTAYIGGFGSGKTHVLNLQILREASRGPCLGLVGAPTYRLLRDTTMRKFFDLCPRVWIKSFSKSEFKVDMVNGAEIIFRSLDTPEALTNLGVSWFALDEIGEVAIETFLMLQGRLRAPGGSHHGFCVGNPAGPSHWSYEYYALREHDSKELGVQEYALIQAPTTENFFLPKHYISRMNDSYVVGSAYHRRFVMGEFVAFEGAYWSNFDVRRFEDGGMVLTDVSKMKLVLRGDVPDWTFGKVIDFGFEHPFVCLWFATDGQSIVFYDEYYQRRTTIKDHCIAIRDHEKEHHSRYKFPYALEAYTDHAAQDRAEIENCRDDDNRYIGFSCIPADKKDVMEGILLVQTIIQERRFYVTDTCKQTKREVPSYHSKPMDKAHGKEAPVKEKDDCCDCVRMAIKMVMRHLNKSLRVEDRQQTYIRVNSNDQLFDLDIAGKL